MTQDNPPVAESVMDDPDQLRALAAKHRAAAAFEQAEAVAALEAARAEAQRLVTEATHRAHQADTRVRVAEREAADLEGRAASIDYAAVLRQQVDDTAAAVVALATEADDLREQVAALDKRLAELGGERENTAAALATAREAADVAQVTALRATLAGVDEVTHVLQTQRQAARERLAAIGDADGIGELAEAAHAWQSKQAELRRVENLLDPDSPRAVADRLADELRAALAANVERIHEQQTQQPASPVVIRTGQR